MRTSRVARFSSGLVALATLALIGVGAVPAVLAAPVATEVIVDVTRIARSSDVLTIVESRLTVPPGARWETDPDAGPLTITVETGKMAVFLGGGSARLERLPDPLLGARITPFQLGRLTLLWPGDRLVVVRGFQVVAENDEDQTAVARVSRLSRTPLRAFLTTE